MSPPRPSSGLIDARRILRDDAVAQAERRLGIDHEVMPAVAALATEQLQVALDGIDVRHAGWGLLATGTALVTHSERIPAAGSPSVAGALAWSALLAAVVGERLLESERPPARDWAPGEVAQAARPIAHELAGRADAPSLVAEVLDLLDRQLGQLDPGAAGWALLVTGVWIGAHDERLVVPLVRRRLFARRVVKDADQARAGCDLTAALLCRIGEVLIARSVSIASIAAGGSGRESR